MYFFCQKYKALNSFGTWYDEVKEHLRYFKDFQSEWPPQC